MERICSLSNSFPIQTVEEDSVVAGDRVLDTAWHVWRWVHIREASWVDVAVVGVVTAAGHEVAISLHAVAVVVQAQTTERDDSYE